jgi:hypothetical protein
MRSEAGHDFLLRTAIKLARSEILPVFSTLRFVSGGQRSWPKAKLVWPATRSYGQ